MNEKHQESVMWCWEEAERFNTMTPLMAEIKKAQVSAMKGDDVFRVLGELNEEILAQKEGKYNPKLPRVLAGHEYSGKWHVTNKDMRIASDLAMFAERKGVKLIFSIALEKLAIKRAQQAYDRYKSKGLTLEHLTLLAEMGWTLDFSRGDWVSLYVEGKRPFGNSSIVLDIYELLNWPSICGDDKALIDEEEERAWDIFDELVFAIEDSVKIVKEKFENNKEK